MRTNIQKILITLSMAFLLSACAKEEKSPVPYVIIDINVPLAAYPDLAGGNPVKLTNIPTSSCGYLNHGIIVAPFGSEYYAYDATCTNDISHAINIDGGGAFTATCPKCKIVYNILGANNGFPKNSTGVRLKQYHAYSANNNSRLIIKN